VLGTARGEGGKVVFTNVVSYSDGRYSQKDRRNATGVPYFFLTTLDESAKYLEKEPSASFTISEKSSDIDGRCGAVDAQEPPCARITLSGKVKPVRSKREEDFAKQAFFSKHPAMERWPSDHKFIFFKMDVEDVFFLNDYGGASPISVKEYLNVRLDNTEANERIVLSSRLRRRL